MASKQRTENQAALQEAIAAYVRERANAAESAEGVQRSWLGGRAPLDDVKRALDALVQSGVLVAHVLPGGTVVYRGQHPDGAD